MKPDPKPSNLPVGELLRKERELRGIAIQEVSRVTRVRVDYLLSIEKGEFQAIPAEVYVRGYVRAYARFLGLDPEATIARYAQQQPDRQPAPVAVRIQTEVAKPRSITSELTPVTGTSRGMLSRMTSHQAGHSSSRLGLVLALVLLLLAALAISLVYLVNRPGDATASGAQKPSTTETSAFEVNS